MGSNHVHKTAKEAEARGRGGETQEFLYETESKVTCQSGKEK